MGIPIPLLVAEDLARLGLLDMADSIWKDPPEWTDREKLTSWRSDINCVIMDYLVNEGYPRAAEKFAQETRMAPADFDSINERVQIRNAIHAGDLQSAIEMINECNSQVLDVNPLLHFDLLQLQLIELIRTILNKPSSPSTSDFTPAIQFATQQLAPRAPTDPKHLQALEHTMALMIFPPGKMAPEFKNLLDLNMRQLVARKVNEAILASQGASREAKIRQLVRARVWAEQQARQAKVDLPSTVPIGLDLEDEPNGSGDADAMVT